MFPAAHYLSNRDTLIISEGRTTLTARARVTPSRDIPANSCDLPSTRRWKNVATVTASALLSVPMCVGMCFSHRIFPVIEYILERLVYLYTHVCARSRACYRKSPVQHTRRVQRCSQFVSTPPVHRLKRDSIMKQHSSVIEPIFARAKYLILFGVRRHARCCPPGNIAHTHTRTRALSISWNVRLTFDSLYATNLQLVVIRFTHLSLSWMILLLSKC